MFLELRLSDVKLLANDGRQAGLRLRPVPCRKDVFIFCVIEVVLR